MFVIKYKKTGEFIKDLYRNDGLGIPDLHMTEHSNEAKLFSRSDANDLVDRFKNYGSQMKFEVCKAWGRRPN